MFQKNPQKFHGKAVQSNILWPNLNKIGGISILLLAHKQGNPSFHFHAPGSKRGYPCIQTASAVPKYFSCLLQFCTGYRIWHASRVWKRKTARSWKYPDTTNTFSLFLDEFLPNDLRPIYCSLTTQCCRMDDMFLHAPAKCENNVRRSKSTPCSNSKQQLTGARHSYILPILPCPSRLATRLRVC